MKVFIGLGNPGKKYENTRHNIGFIGILDLAREWNIDMRETKFKCIYGTGFVGTEKVMLVMPQTFMNLSGEGARPLIDYYNVDLEDVVVLYDDLDLPLGRVRLRQKGSAGGHNGIKSLTQHFGTEKYKRVRMGIGRPDGRIPIINWVLGRFTDEEIPVLNKVVAHTTRACEAFLSESFIDVMNKYNGDVDV